MRERIGECKSFIVNGTVGISIVAVGSVLRFKGCPGKQVPPTEQTDQRLEQEPSGGRHV
jgi:hypothetical protein